MQIRDIRPDYYQICGETGKRILSHWLSDNLLNQECREVIRLMGNDFDLGNALKYLWRVGKKPNARIQDDLAKARFYLHEYQNQFINGYNRDVARAIAKIEQELARL